VVQVHFIKFRPSAREIAAPCSRELIKLAVGRRNDKAARPGDQALEDARPTVAFYAIVVLDLVSARARTNVAWLRWTRVFDVAVERISLQCRRFR